MNEILDDLAERMLAPATRLVCAVQDHDVDDAHRLLSGLDVLELRALAVVMAALVPDDATLEDLLAWTRNAGPISPRRAAVNRARLMAAVASIAAEPVRKRGAA